MYRCKTKQIPLYSTVILALILTLLSGIWTKPAHASPYVTADSAIVIDAETGAVLSGKNVHTRMAPASTTKIMTAILGIELGNLKDKVRASTRAAREGGSSIWLAPGEVLALEELLYGIMLNSGNDASVAVAEHIAGSVEKFAELMNRKAREVGALNTTFKNPNGLPNNEHLTTAYDLAMIMRYGMQNSFFRQLNSTKYKSISWPGNTWNRGLRNHNKLLWMYTDCDGGKTGYTNAAGRCLVSTAQRNGRRVIAVVLHADQLWQDSIALLDYGLDNFTNLTLIQAGQVQQALEFPESREKKLEVAAARNFVVTVGKGHSPTVSTTVHMKENLQLPIRAGQKVGVLEVAVDGKKVGLVDLVAQSNVTEDSIVNRFFRWITSIIKTFA